MNFQKLRPYLLRSGLVFLFLISFRVFLPDVAPHITAGDSGELILSGVTLGVAHSPGYPVFSQVNKLGGAFLRFGNPAYRQNVMSALFLSLALVVLGVLFVVVSGQRWSAGLPALLLFSDVFRHQAYVTEVFSVSVLWGVFMLFATITLRRSSRHMFLLAFLGGFGLALHQTLVLIYPALLLFLYLSPVKKKEKWWTAVPLSLFFFFLGLSVFLYLPIRSFAQPVLDWEDPQTFSRFWGVLTRARYGFFQLSQGAGPQLTLARLGEVLLFSKNVLINNCGWVGLVLLVFGSLQCLAKPFFRRVLATVWTFILVSGPFFFWYANVPLKGDTDIFSRFTILPLSGAVFIMGLGCTFLWASKLWLYRGFMGALLLGFVIENVSIQKKHDVISMRWDLAVREAAINTLKMMPMEAVLVADRADETEFSMGYLLLGERRRPQTQFIDANAGVTRSIYGDDYYGVWGKPRLARRENVERLLVNSSEIPVFYATLDPTMIDIARTPRGLLHKAWSYQDLQEPDHFLWDKVLSWRFLPKENRSRMLYGTNMNLLGRSFFEAGAYPAAINAFGLGERFGGANRYELMGYWLQVRGEYGPALSYYNQALAAGVISEAVFSNGGALLLEMGRASEAVGMYEQGLKHFRNSVDILYNLAVAKWQQGEMDDVKKLVQRILSIQPRHDGALGLASRLR